MFVFTLLACLMGTSAIQTFEEVLQQTDHTAKKKVAFWHINAATDRISGIVAQQLYMMKANQLYDELDHIIYCISGPLSHMVNINAGDKFVRYDHGQNAREEDTLAMLSEFCRLNIFAKVLYFHDKDTPTFDAASIRHRHALNCFTLNSNCIDSLDRHDTCGFRLTAYPHLHYSGNFWWARCQYINTLIHPKSFENKTFSMRSDEMLQSFKDRYFPNDPNVARDGMDSPRFGYGKYFAETWIGTGRHR
jgi:hypothetical protein